MKEDDDLNLAIALSLSEAFSKDESKAHAPSKYDSDADFALALKLQEEENEKSISNSTNNKHHNKTDEIYDSSPKFSSKSSNDSSSSKSNNTSSLFDSSLCYGCKWPFISGAIVNYGGKRYHPPCFKCAHCERPIQGKFVLNGEPVNHYHPECAETLFIPTCSLCPEKLNGRFYKHPFFTESCYCQSHEGTRKSCFSCNRKEPLPSSGKEGFSHLPDGRALCMDCAQNVIIDSSEAKPLYDAVVDFMEYVLMLPIPEGMRVVPILAVDLPSLNEQRKNTSKVYHGSSGSGDSTSDHHTAGPAVTRGLTLKEISSVNHFAPGSLSIDPFTGNWTSSGPRVFQTNEVRSATAVLVLFGLPSDTTASILAHEAMHVWCSLTKDFPFHLPPQVEEGLCQLIAFKYIEHCRNNYNPSSSSSSSYICTSKTPTKNTNIPSKNRDISLSNSNEDWNARLRAYISTQIETDPSPIYGEGFRKAAACSSALGLDILLNYIKDYKDFPKIT